MEAVALAVWERQPAGYRLRGQLQDATGERVMAGIIQEAVPLTRAPTLVAGASCGGGSQP